MTQTFKVSEMAGAIMDLFGPPVPDVTLLTSAEWENLTTAQKQAHGLVAIQSTESGYSRGILVNGADYEENT